MHRPSTTYDSEKSPRNLHPWFWYRELNGIICTPRSCTISISDYDSMNQCYHFKLNWDYCRAYSDFVILTTLYVKKIDMWLLYCIIYLNVLDFWWFGVHIISFILWMFNLLHSSGCLYLECIYVCVCIGILRITLDLSRTWVWQQLNHRVIILEKRLLLTPTADVLSWACMPRAIWPIGKNP